MSFGARKRRTEKRRQARVDSGLEHLCIGSSEIQTFHKKRSSEPKGNNEPPQKGTPGRRLRDLDGRSLAESGVAPRSSETGT